MESNFSNILAASVSFVCGFVGWPLALYSAKPVAEIVLKPWGKVSPRIMLITVFLSYLFLLNLMFAVLGFVNNLFSTEMNPSFSLRRLTFFASFFGFAALPLLIKIEKGFSKIAKRKKG
jgi:hypothetical protein